MITFLSLAFVMLLSLSIGCCSKYDPWDCLDCVVPENIHPSPHGWSFKNSKGVGVSKAKIFEQKYEAELEFLEGQGWGGGFQSRNPSMGKVWIFSGTKHYSHAIEMYSKSLCSV